jgi:signal transduction histidine kinase
MQQREERPDPTDQPPADTQARLLDVVFNAYDAITQTLFSASLIADVLPRMWERDPDEGRTRLNELRLLTRGALAEMRSLLLELRPAALAELDFDDLLRQLCDGFMAQAGVLVSLHLEGERDLPEQVKNGLYHLAQAALQQAVRRSADRQVDVWLACRPEGVLLTIQGAGLAENAGACLLEDCARSIGAELRVDNPPGAGPRMVISWSPAKAQVSGE